MTKYIVTLESYNSEFAKRVTVMAASEYDAMAVAQMKCRGWHPVDVELA